MKQYDLLLADPPWLYSNPQQNDPSRGGLTYPSLTMKEMQETDVGSLGKKDSVLVMWVTFPKLVDYNEKYTIFTMLKEWNYKPKTALFVWVKTNKSADREILNERSFYSGLGYYTNSNAEIALIATRGKGLPRITKSVKQLIISPLRKHSEKPREQYDRLHTLYGYVDRIELFARKQNPPPEGWDATGLDYDGKTIQDFIKERKG